MSTEPNQLLIIGNGFDLRCGLKSSFKHYLEDLKNKYPFIENMNQNSINENKRAIDPLIKELSLWEILLLKREGEYENWADVEFFVFKNVINKHKLGTRRLSNFELVVESGFNLDDLNTDKDLDIASIAYFKHFYKYYQSQYNDENIDLQNLLFNEIKKFELNFCNYLRNEVEYSNYKQNSKNLFYELIEEEPTLLLNFNYTRPGKYEYIMQETNIHGTLIQNNVIIGVDFKDFNPDDIGFKLSKTYRKMLHKPKDIYDFKLNKHIETLIVYGHSLNHQDYSYFYSIFDYLDIYSGEIKLLFFYSSGHIKEEPKDEYATVDMTKRVSDLIIDYGNTMANKDHGRNLLHKLLLEGRLKFKDIDK